MTQFYRLGGAERLAVELAEELNKRGIHTDILSMYTKDLPGASEAMDSLLHKGVPSVYFLGMKIHPPITSMLPTILKLRRLIRKHEYDIVETSMMAPMVLASWATRFTRAHHVAGIHQVYMRNRQNTVKHTFWRFSVQCNHRIRYYAVSDCVTACWMTYSQTQPQHTRRIYNGIADSYFSVFPERAEVRRELGLSEDDASLALFVGRLAAYKGLDTILEALGPVLEQQNIFVLYVGLPDLDVQGTQEMLQQMRQRISREKLDSRVKFLGYRKDIPRLMAASDVLVHPTRIEGFGLTLAEAMAAGLPVVASNVEGIPEVLTGTDSMMVPPDEPEQLRTAVLNTLHRTPSNAALAIEKGRRRAQEFRMVTRTDSMVRLFEDVLEGSF